SAMDIAVEASWVAERTFLAARRGVWIIPKYLFGRPLDQITTGAAARVPWRLRQVASEAMLRVAAGRLSAYGLPEPEHGVLQAHPTISDSILSRIAHGEVTPKPTIAELCEDSVVFADGSRERIDVVVYATGYHVRFPFFDDGLVSAPGNVLRLFRRVFHPDIPDVAFVGLLQPLGAIMPIAELQGRVVGDYLRGHYQLPGRDAMLAWMRRDVEDTARRYVASPRHTMQVDFDTYMYELDREHRRGQARALALGCPLPVPVRESPRVSRAAAG
ncbi:MAG: flavin-binding monooxygenase-like family protein, partial [Mycobacteriales bacterium]